MNGKLTGEVVRVSVLKHSRILEILTRERESRTRLRLAILRVIGNFVSMTLSRNEAVVVVLLIWRIDETTEDQQLGRRRLPYSRNKEVSMSLR